MQAESEQALCQACGLCCDGTLFRSVMLKDADQPAALSRAGLPLRAAGGTVDFALPCAAHCAGRCQVYEIRPVTCQRFRCKLLNGYATGQVTWAQARQRIAHVRAQLHDVEAARQQFDPALPPLAFTGLLRALKEVGARGQLGPLLLQVAALRHYLRRHFYEPAETQ